MNKVKAKHSVALVTALVMALSLLCTVFAACGGVSISLDKTELQLYVGDSAKIIATVTGDDDAEVEWSTNNESVATVRRGTVSAVGEGSAIITAKLEDGVSATCSVTVSERTVTISQTAAVINLDESNTVTLTATSSDGGAIAWSSNDPALASVVGGVVTAYDIGEVTITAQRGYAKAECVIEIIEPSRPEDYYVITKLTNSEVVANPGTWYYHADGSMGSDYSFESDPLHQNSTASATLNIIPNVANSKYFYFRYQPDQVELNTYYTMNLEITVSEDCTLRIGSKRADGSTFAGMQADVTANQTIPVEYIGYKNEYEPFSVRIDSELSAQNVTISVKLISVAENDGTDLPEYHTLIEDKESVKYEELEKDSSSYDLEAKTNSETINAPEKWHYNQGNGSYVTTANYNDGTIKFEFDTLATDGNNQLRFRPDLPDNTKIKIEFDVTGNVDAKIVLALCDSQTFGSEGWTQKNLTADGTLNFSVEFTLKSVQLIFIQVSASGEAKSNASFTFSNIKLYKASEDQSKPEQPETPTQTGYELTSSNNSGVIANPGKWYYSCDGANGTEYEFASTPKYENGTIIFAFNRMAEGTPTYQLRYQPELAAGTAYTVTFTVELSAPGKVVYGTDYKAYEFAEAGTQTITWEGEVSSSAPFMIQIRSTDRSAPITMTVSNIIIAAV